MLFTHNPVFRFCKPSFHGFAKCLSCQHGTAKKEGTISPPETLRELAFGKLTLHLELAAALRGKEGLVPALAA